MGNPLVDLLQLPPRLAGQALEDLHEIATGGRSFLTLMLRLEARADRIQNQLDATLAAAQAMNDLGERIVTLVEGLDKRADSVLKLGKKIDERGRAMVSLGQQIDSRGENIVAAAEEVSRRAAEMIDALPTIEKAVSIAAPLEGAVERLGRMVDRLPDGRNKKSTS